MTRHARRSAALLAAAAAAVLAWPGPAAAGTGLGGYSGSAQAVPLRLQIYEPVIPLPSTPQIDAGIGFTRSTTDTGPVSRALASYLWPGDVIGDGFSQLTGDPSSKYPVQVDSRDPATSDSPASNTAQLTDGNGMTTSSTSTATTATVTGAGIAGPGTDLLGGLGQGLGQLGGSAPSTSPSTSSGTATPVPVGSTLAALATIQGLKSESDVVLSTTSVTSTARASAGTISLLGGLVSLGGMDAYSSTVSNGTRATTSGSVTFGAITVAGQKFGFGDKGVSFGASSTALPAVPSALTSLLSTLGIRITPFVTTRTASGASGSLATTGLEISVDTVPLKNLLNVSAVTDPIAQVLSTIPQLGSQLAPLLSLGPKIVLLIGDVSTSATAAPAYSGDSTSAPASGGSSAGSAAGTRITGGGGAGGGALGGGSVSGGGAAVATGGGARATSPVTSTPITPTASTGYDLPPLGAVPKALILGGLALALAAGWLLRTSGAMLFGSGGGCEFGLDSGVPDLRQARRGS